jgi:hypothetical protein
VGDLWFVLAGYGFFPYLRVFVGNFRYLWVILGVGAVLLGILAGLAG